MRVNTPLNTIVTDVNVSHYDAGPSSTDFNISTQGINVTTWVSPSDFILLLHDVASRSVLFTEDQEKEVVELCKKVVNECDYFWRRRRACDACDLEPFPACCENCEYSEAKHV